MKNTKLFGRVITLLLTATILMAGCQKNKDNAEETIETAGKNDTITINTETETVKETEEETVVETEEVLPEGQTRSILTGEIITTEVAAKRPVAVMVNNIEDAIKQQAGTSTADILYEAVVEGNITRMLAITQDTSIIEKIGTVRSARHYYIDFANNYNAIYCHYGQSIYATDRIQSSGIKTVSENNLSAYFQDNNYSAPHHIFANGETLEAGIAAAGIVRNLPDNFEGPFVFNKEDTDPAYGTVANTVKIPFVYSQAELKYNPETKLYDKFQYGKEHTDANNGEQLTFKNVIIQYNHYEDIPGGSGCQEVTLNGEGKALYITNGTAVNVTWKRANAAEQTKYYYEDGTQVAMNIGKTYIAVVPEDFDITLSE